MPGRSDHFGVRTPRCSNLVKTWSEGPGHDVVGLEEHHSKYVNVHFVKINLTLTWD